jgi:phosphoserine phosphatase RsbU/P
MNISIGDILIDLVKTACVIVVFAYVFSRTRLFSSVLEKQFTPRNSLIIILLFGALSIFGTYGGIQLPSGAIANIRDLGPVVAGLIGGPVIGLAAGLIGGMHRYFLGGFVALPCALSTTIAGLAGGLLYRINRKDLPPIWQAVILVVLIESLHMGIVLLIARPYDEALAVVREVVGPMMGANVMAVVIFGFIIKNLIAERKTAADKEKYRRELERREFEAETARKIQQSFLPETTPRIEGFDMAAISLPAWEVGGDFYDFIPISQNVWGIVIADVSGKGFPAALFMALSRTCVRANVMGKGGVSEAISRANQLISEESRSGMFVTLFYAVLDTEKRHLRYVNAGHNPPLLLTNKTSKATLLKAKGIALGVMDGVEFEEKEVYLEDNDVVVFYTDGVTEAINTSEEQFGEERLLETIKKNISLTAQEMVDRLKDEVHSFAQGQPPFDDFTLVAVRTTGENNGGKQ